MYTYLYIENVYVGREIEDFVESHLCELCVIDTSIVRATGHVLISRRDAPGTCCCFPPPFFSGVRVLPWMRSWCLFGLQASK